MTKVYRVENQRTKCGLFFDFEGNFGYKQKVVYDGLHRPPVKRNEHLFRKEGKIWFSAFPSKEGLRDFLSRENIFHLLSEGYCIYEFEVKTVEFVYESEVMFTREDVVKQTILEYAEVWDETTFPPELFKFRDSIIGAFPDDDLNCSFKFIAPKCGLVIFKAWNGENRDVCFQKEMQWYDAHSLMKLLQEETDRRKFQRAGKHPIKGLHSTRKTILKDFTDDELREELESRAGKKNNRTE